MRRYHLKDGEVVPRRRKRKLQGARKFLDEHGYDYKGKKKQKKVVA